MRILIATQTYDPKINGQGVFTIHLAEGLARAGYEVTVLMPSARGRGYSEDRAGVQLRAVGALSLAPFYRDVCVTLSPTREVGSWLDRLQPEIVHIQDHYPLCRSVLRAALTRNLPVIGTNHFLPENMASQIPFSGFCARFVDRVLWWTVLDVMNRTRVVTTPSRTAAEILRQQQIRVPVEPISCGVDLTGFAPDEHVNRIEMRQRYGLDPESTIFFYLGRLDPEKRVDVLLHALARVQHSDLQLAIAGRGRQAGTLEDLARRLGLARRVVFAGFVPAEDLPALLNSVDLFAMPSEAELLSIATLEAMATGKPVLAANARALPELVENDVNGYLFRAGDAEDAARCVDRLAGDKHRWCSMGKASRNKASRHDLAFTIRAYLELYDRVTQSKRWVRKI